MRVALCLSVLLAACGPQPEPPATSDPSAAPGPSSLADDPCALLSADAAARAFGMAPGGFERTTPPGECLYMQEDGRHASVHSIQIYDSAAAAAEAFRTQYLVPAPMEAAEPTYEAVEGIGDRAIYDRTIRETDDLRVAASTLFVLDGPLILGATGDVFVADGEGAMRAGPSEADIARNRDAAVAVARIALESAR